MDSFVEMERTNQHARIIIGEEAEKIAKISRRETKATDFLKEQKTKGNDKVPENLNQKISVRLPRLRRNMRRSIPMWEHYRGCWQALRFRKEARSWKSEQ